MKTNRTYNRLICYYRDHLGNNVAVRNMVSDSIVQRTVYYASGLPMAQSTSAGKQPYKYNGKEFVEMHGLDEYDSQARWYYPAILRTTTMDPMAESYYHISPYAWCGNNPIANIDVTGKKYKVVTNGHTKTVKATIYTDKKSKKSAQKAADFWNNQKGKKYTSKKGKQYDVKFEIIVKEVKDDDKPAHEAGLDNSETGNSYIVQKIDQKSPIKGFRINGETKKEQHITVSPDRAETATGAHEVGHILSLGDTDEGIMTWSASAPGSSDEVTQDNIDQIIESDQKRHPISTIIESIKERISKDDNEPNEKK